MDAGIAALLEEIRSTPENITKTDNERLTVFDDLRTRGDAHERAIDELSRCLSIALAST